MEKGCRYLKLKKFNKGDTIIKYKDKAEHFFIAIKGRFGTFVPKGISSLQKEVSAVDWLTKQAKKSTLKRTEVLDIMDTIDSQHQHYDLLSQILRVEDKKVVYKKSTLRKLTGLSSKELRNQDYGFFFEAYVSIESYSSPILSLSILITRLEEPHGIRPGPYRERRLDVWGEGCHLQSA